MKRNLSTLIAIAAFVLLPVLLPTRVAAAALSTVGAPVTSNSAMSVATHVVQRGDTLYSIARRYNTTVDALLRINGLESDTIWIGQVLQITSSPSSFVPSAPSAGNIVHTVVREDTLYSLSRRYGSTVEAIMQVNHLSGTNIYVGQRLLIASTSALPAQNSTYTVEYRDTLYSIAKRYGTTVEAIMALNNLSSTHIFVGQRLLITATSAPSVPTTLVPTTIPRLTPIPNPMGPSPSMPTRVPPSISTPVPSASPTATGQFTTYECSSNIYNCENFGPQEEAQRIYEYCFNLTGRDIHDLDRDNDAVACEENLQTAAPTATGPFTLNECGSNTYNCDRFGPQEDAQRTFEYCRNLNGGDIHDLDRDDDGVACEENLPRGFTVVR